MTKWRAKARKPKAWCMGGCSITCRRFRTWKCSLTEELGALCGRATCQPYIALEGEATTEPSGTLMKDTVGYPALVLQVELLVGGELIHGIRKDPIE